MKRFFNFRRAFAVAASLVLVVATSCQNDDATENKPKQEVFAVEKSVDYDNIYITVTPPDDCPKYFIRPYTKRSLPTDLNDNAMLAYIISSPEFSKTIFEGVQEIPFAGLIGNSNYSLIYFGLDEEGQAKTELHREDFKTPAAPNKYNFEVISLGAFNIDVKVTPSDNSPYYAGMCKKSVYEQYGGDDYGLILMDISWWQQVATWAEEAGTPTTWQKCYLEDELVTDGTRNINNLDYGLDPAWNSEYVVYAFSLDENGNVVNHVNKIEITTPSPVPSQNTFECEILQTWTDGVEFTITPSNNDPYFISIQNHDRFVSYYGPEAEFTYDDMLLRILEDATPEYIAARTFTGPQTINTLESDGVYQIKSPEANYDIIVVGLNNGPTTDYNFFGFRSENSAK